MNLPTYKISYHAIGWENTVVNFVPIEPVSSEQIGDNHFT